MVFKPNLGYILLFLPSCPDVHRFMCIQPGLAWVSSCACVPASSQAMECGCFVMQVGMLMVSWAMAPLLFRLPQWRCLAHTPSHSYQQAILTLVACLAVGLRCAGVSVGAGLAWWVGFFHVPSCPTLHACMCIQPSMACHHHGGQLRAHKQPNTACMCVRHIEAC
jgi:hypothetical protein